MKSIFKFNIKEVLVIFILFNKGLILLKLSKKGKKINASLTLAISAKAGEMKNNGVDVVSFGAGEPDFDTPEYISNAGIEAINKGFTNYTPASGTRDLKKAIIEKFKRDNGLEYNLDQIIVSNGAKHSLFNAFQSILNQGDEVIVSQPYWVSYPELIKMGGGRPVLLKAKEENNFKINIDDLKKTITSKTKAILLNSPNNPTGCVYNRSELEEIADLAVKKDIFVVSDEIYEKIIYDDREHISVASLGDDIKKRTIVINGMSKSYAMTGWRIGFAAAEKDVIKMMSNIQSHSTSNANSIAQYASTVGLNNGSDEVEKMVAEFEKRRNFMVDKINDIDGISSTSPDGAFYVMANISRLIDKKYNARKIDGSMSFAEILLDEKEVAVVPGIAFGSDNFVRLSYAVSLSEIKKGLKRIEKFVAEIGI